MRFLADHMLGSLARWLRFLGFDTAYPHVLPDGELKRMAAEDDRILLTRDRELAQSRGIRTLYIHSIDLDEQLDQVINAFELDIDEELSRCSLCNTRLVSIDKEHVEGKVPARVFEGQSAFWECRKCDKYYWPGTHYKKIKSKLAQLKGKTRGA